MRLPVVCCICILQFYSAFAQKSIVYDVVIHEILPKPSPVAGLPPYEYIELCSRSKATINLENWRLKVNSREVALPPYVLKPDSLVVFCSESGATAYNKANIAGVSKFPAIADDTALITLYDPDHKVVHALSYHQGWYGKTSRNGRSLEMADLSKPCDEASNWFPSLNPSGGTPGIYNSVNGQADDIRPDLLYAIWKNNQQFQLFFSKPLDSSIAVNTSHYALPKGWNIQAISATPPLFKDVIISIGSPVQTDSIYIITTNGLTDCKGRESQLFNMTMLGTGMKPERNDVVINEILPYTSTSTSEFIELYNGSKKVISLDQLFLGSRKKDGTVSGFKKLTATARILPPSGFLALTTDKNSLCNRFSCRAPDKIVEVASLPSMAMDEGTIVLLRSDSVIIDEFHYTDSLYFALLNSSKDRSLERLAYDRPSYEPANWQSASDTYGGATPGFENSQRWVAAVNPANIALYPDIIFPDTESAENKAVLHWELPVAGCLGNITIFNLQGKPVKHLARNLIMGNSGELAWNGTDENAAFLTSGVYIFLIEIFNLQGATKYWKRTVTVARNLK